MGETTAVTRTLGRLTPGKERDPRSYTLGYRYDYQGRMETITYPDGERLTYHYDAGGQVNRVVGTWNGTEYVYVEAIGYDEFGQRNRIRYGNGVATTYQYDPNRRWLAHITTTGGTTTLQSIDYRFDTRCVPQPEPCMARNAPTRVGNILGTINTGTTR